MNVPRRLARGYATIGKSVFRLVVGAAILLAVAAAVAFPLWFLADSLPRVFDVVVLGIVGAVAVYTVVRRVPRRSDSSVDGHRGRLPTSLAVIVGAVATIIGIVVGNAALVGIGLVAATGGVAWRVAR